MMQEFIIGSGGGGGGGKGGGGGNAAPVEQPDSLHSRDSIMIIDALCEGEIVGLVNGLQSVFFNDTPVQNTNGTYNFTNLQLNLTTGAQFGGGGLRIAAAAEARSEVAVGVRIMAAMPVVRRVADLNANAVDVRLSCPSLVLADTSGNLSGSAIGFTIDINTNGGGYQTYISDAFSGKTTRKYDRTYRIPLPSTGPWDIRVTRITADSTSSLLQNELWFDAITEIVAQKLSYPNTAMVSIATDASAFQSIPRRAYEIKGMVVRIPSNYNPITRSYSGVWNGTFALAWTDNPAWCFYDLLTNPRYGLGGYLPANSIDKWGLYSIAQHCDALVPDGFGGFEPRFTLNLYIGTRAEAYSVVNQLASAFRAMVYWANGSIFAVQDAPADPVSLFAAANVIDGAFSYSGASRKAMHTVALVQWNDPKNNYLPAIEYVEDAASIAKYGVIEAQISAVGCTSRGQAHRLGLWLLYSEKLEQEVVSFKASLDTAYLRPGQIIQIQDAHRSGKRVGGRLLAAGISATVLPIDAPITIEVGKSYAVSVVLPNGEIGKSFLINAVGATSILYLLTPLTSIPLENALWIVSVSDLSPTLWRVLSVAETAKNEYSVSALAHNPTKFSAIELGMPLQVFNTIAIPSTPSSPVNITLREELILDGGVVRSRLNIDWDRVQYAVRYKVSWRAVPGNFASLSDTAVNHSEVIDAPVGAVEVRIEAINTLGMAGVASVSSGILQGKTAPPADVAQFYVSRSVNNLFFSWSHVPDLDKDHYEIRLGANWDVAQLIGTSVNNQWSTSLSQGGQYLIKAVDTTGHYSVNATACVVSSNAAINVVLTDDDASYGWIGTKTNMVVVGASLDLALISPLEAFPTGSYTSDIHDLGRVMACTFSISPVLEQVVLGMSLDSYPLPLSAYNFPLSGVSGNISASYEIRFSIDNITWSAWQPFVPGLLAVRYYQLRASFSAKRGYQVRLHNLPITVDMPDRVERYTGLSIPIAGMDVVFNIPFTSLDSVQITVQNGTAGDNVTITNRSVSGISLKGYNGAGVSKVVVVDIDVYGY